MLQGKVRGVVPAAKQIGTRTAAVSFPEEDDEGAMDDDDDLSGDGGGDGDRGGGGRRRGEGEEEQPVPASLLQAFKAKAAALRGKKHQPLPTRDDDDDDDDNARNIKVTRRSTSVLDTDPLHWEDEGGGAPPAGGARRVTRSANGASWRAMDDDDGAEAAEAPLSRREKRPVPQPNYAAEDESGSVGTRPQGRGGAREYDPVMD